MATLASFKKLGKERKKAEKEEDSKKRGKMMEKIDEKRSKTASEEIKGQLWQFIQPHRGR